MQFNIINIPKIDSTNSYAQQLIEKGNLHEGDVIFTSNQEMGRGQGDNYWESEPGSNLALSLILEPKLVPASYQFVLTQIVSLAIVNLLKEYIITDDVKVKWPNDIYVNDNKIAGILFQNFVKGNQIEHSIVGIGININQKQFFSSAPNPVSMIHHIQDSVNINDLLNKLLDKIGVAYEEYKRGDNFRKLKSAYLRNLYRYNEWHVFSENKVSFNGKIVDVDEYGRLMVEIESGEVRKFMFKEIEFEI